MGIVGALISWHQKGCGDAFSCSFVTVLMMSSGTDYARLSTTEAQLCGPWHLLSSPSATGPLSIGYVVFSPGFIYLIAEKPFAKGLRLWAG